jgi:sucrose phosphorylase
MLSLLGVPGIYFHSLFGSRNWNEGVNLTKQYRTINRQKLEQAELESELANPNSLRSQVFGRFRQLLFQRAASAAFHPKGRQKILNMGHKVFAVLRSSPDGDKHTLCIQNVTAQKQSVETYSLKPYQTLWVDNP